MSPVFVERGFSTPVTFKSSTSVRSLSLSDRRLGSDNRCRDITTQSMSDLSTGVNMVQVGIRLYRRDGIVLNT